MQNSLFSSLLSQDEALQTTLAAQTQTTMPVQASSPAVTTTQSSSLSSAPSSSSSESLSDAGNDGAVVIQKFSDIATTVHKIMMLLRQRSANAPSSDSDNAQAEDSQVPGKQAITDTQKTPTSPSASTTPIVTPNAATTNVSSVKKSVASVSVNVAIPAVTVTDTKQTASAATGGADRTCAITFCDCGRTSRDHADDHQK